MNTFDFRMEGGLRIPAGWGFRMWWPLYLVLAIFLPPLFLFLPIRAPAAVMVLIGFLSFASFSGAVERWVLRAAPRAPPLAR